MTICDRKGLTTSDVTREDHSPAAEVDVSSEVDRMFAIACGVRRDWSAYRDDCSWRISAPLRKLFLRVSPGTGPDGGSYPEGMGAATVVPEITECQGVTVLVGTGVSMAPSAVKRLSEALVESEAELAYCDEYGFFKPDYAPILQEGMNYMGRFVAVKNTLLERSGPVEVSDLSVERMGGRILDLARRASSVLHVTEPLYRVVDKVDFDIARGGGVPAADLPDLKVSIVIPTRNHLGDLRKCVGSIVAKSTWRNFEILIVDNGSTDRRLAKYYKSIGQCPAVRVLSHDVPFNYSEINNYAVSQATGEYLLFLNNDTEVLTPDWMQRMLEYAVRPGVGAVGAKLLYPNGTIQHAGVVLGIDGVAAHRFLREPRRTAGYNGLARVAGEVGAATAACLMVRKAVFDSLAGFDETFAVAFNDVDLCLRIRKAGFSVVWTPHAELAHYESRSRGYENTPAKARRFAEEIRRFRSRWRRELLLGDPFYSPNLSRWLGLYTPLASDVVGGHWSEKREIADMEHAIHVMRRETDDIRRSPFWMATWPVRWAKWLYRLCGGCAS